MALSQAQYDWIVETQGQAVANNVAMAEGGVTPTEPGEKGYVDPIGVPMTVVIGVDDDGVAPDIAGIPFFQDYPNEPGMDLRSLFVGASPRVTQAPAGAYTQQPAPGPTRGPVGGPAGGLPVIFGAGALLARFLPGVMGGTFRTFLAPFTRGTTIVWSQIPSWLRQALGAIGITTAIDILVDLPGPGIRDIIPGGGNGAFPEFHGPGGHPGIVIVGGWVANGVQFYRLSDGKLAVQNKLGRWKVWRPKKPIVIMPTGAGDLRTLLRADKVLNTQAKRIASMLNRRASPRRSRKTAIETGTPVVISHGKVV